MENNSIYRVWSAIATVRIESKCHITPLKLLK